MRLVQELHDSGLEAELRDASGEVVVSTKRGQYIGSFPKNTPLKAVLLSLQAYKRGYKDGRQSMRKVALNSAASAK